MRRLLITAIAVALAGFAHAGSATWTWPTQRQDGSALPLTAIGGFTIYDTTVPVANLPGTPITGCTASMPPTTATGACTAAFTVGHSFVIVVGDTSTPSNLSGVSATAIAITAISPPKPATSL